ncbi:MAG: rhodanese-like domain-containing protein [Clostridia bacterium]|nr:rhodanese-like domain-containing protein [Clostridia bacterium]
MRKIVAVMLMLIILAGCGAKNGYISISAEKAKEMMDKEENYIILDVRNQDEYDEKHIPGAILIPNTEIEDRAEDELPDKNQLILVYCRSGNRSKKASQILADMGYTNIKEFGGINDWPYEVE